MKETGMKYDSGKPMMDLIPPAAEMALARVLTFGANKYAPNSWQTVEDGERRYMAAAMRHINAHRSGEMFDEESGELHLSHALTCLAFLIELTENHLALGDGGWTAEAIEAAAFKHTLTDAETAKAFYEGEARMEQIGQNANDGGAYPLTKEQLSTENWYCLQHDGEVEEALVSLGVQVWEELLWKKGLWECCMLDGHKTAARPYDADVLEVLKRENPDAYEIRLINGQFYRA